MNVASPCSGKPVAQVTPRVNNSENRTARIAKVEQVITHLMHQASRELEMSQSEQCSMMDRVMKNINGHSNLIPRQDRELADSLRDSSLYMGFLGGFLFGAGSSLPPSESESPFMYEVRASGGEEPGETSTPLITGGTDSTSEDIRSIFNHAHEVVGTLDDDSELDMSRVDEEVD